MKPAVPQGTRDFAPQVVRRRQYIFDVLRDIFERYGFQPLETPAMENLTTLTGKYGEEGDRLIFKILNNGLHEKKDRKREEIQAAWAQIMEKPVSASVITERALRYDLTIPFARFVATNHQALPMPFKRYQMQPVWRADRPQRGRYREFWQCDCDVVGSTSLLNEADLIAIYREAFERLGLLGVVVKINSRKVLEGLAEWCNAPEKLIDITVALDKLDKIGWDGVAAELTTRGIDAEAIQKIQDFVALSSAEDAIMLQGLEETIGETGPGRAGIQELRETLRLHQMVADERWTSSVKIDTSLARGLNYYTGIILEVTTSAVKMGSLGGGGRYDDLTGLFGVKGLSGVGISFGVDRIYDVLEELAIFPAEAQNENLVMVVNYGPKEQAHAMGVLRDLRRAGIAAELYPEEARLDKQLKYASRRGVAWVVLPGEEERENGRVSLKNFATGEQVALSVGGVIQAIREARPGAHAAQ